MARQFSGDEVKNIVQKIFDIVETYKTALGDIANDAADIRFNFLTRKFEEETQILIRQLQPAWQNDQEWLAMNTRQKLQLAPGGKHFPSPSGSSLVDDGTSSSSTTSGFAEPIYDPEDHVDRCPSCLWEVTDSHCSNTTCYLRVAEKHVTTLRHITRENPYESGGDCTEEEEEEEEAGEDFSSMEDFIDDGELQYDAGCEVGLQMLEGTDRGLTDLLGDMESADDDQDEDDRDEDPASTTFSDKELSPLRRYGDEISNQDDSDTKSVKHALESKSKSRAANACRSSLAGKLFVSEEEEPREGGSQEPRENPQQDTAAQHEVVKSVALAAGSRECPVGRAQGPKRQKLSERVSIASRRTYDGSA